MVVIQPSMSPLPKLHSLALVFFSMPKRRGTSKTPKDPHHDKNEVLPRHKAQVQTFETYVLLKKVVSLE